MDEVEIKNVGGRSGVASEVTLQRLLDATTQTSTNASAAAQTRKRLVETSNKAQKDNTSILGKATAGVKGFAKEFVSGGDRVSDFSKHVLGASSRLQNLVEYLDDNVDQFRSLSQVGAGFNNSIFDMMKSAGMSAMRMDEYYRVVQDNSEVLRMLGGSVTEGAKQFGDLSRKMRQGDIGDNLFNLGFTIGDVNDGLLNYINIQALQGRLEGMSQRQLISGSQDYLVEIDKLSKATGLSRDAILDQQSAMQNSAKYQSLIARGGAAGADELSKSLGIAAQLLGPGLADDLTLIASGNGGLSDFYKGLIAMGSEGQAFAGVLENMGNVSTEETIAALSQLGPDVAEALSFRFSPAQLQMLENTGSVIGNVAGVIGNLSAMGNIDIAAASEQQEAQDKVTNFLTSFGNQLQQVKTNVLDAIIKSDFGKAVTKLGTSLGAALTSLFGDGSAAGGAFGSLSTGIGDAVEKLTGPDGYLTKLTDTIRREVEAFTAATSPNAANRVSPIDYLRERAGELGTQLKNWFTDMFLGKVVEKDRDFGNDIRQGGIIENISNGFSSLMTIAKDKLIDKVFGPASEGQEDMNIFSRIIDETVTGIKNAFESESFQTKLDSIVDSLKPIMEAAFAKLMAALNETWLGFLIPDSATMTSQEIIEDLTAKINNQVANVEGARQSTDAYAGYAVQGSESGLRSLLAEYAEAGGDVSSLTLPDNFRRVGTLRATGRSFEPESTVTRVNQGERVLNSSETASMNDLPGAINQLNTLTAQIRDLMTQSVSYQERTARGIRKLGSDIMT